MNRFGCIKSALIKAVCHLMFVVVVTVLLGSWTVYAQFCAYVTNNSSEDVSVIDTATNTVVTTIDTNIASTGIAITPNGAFAYVTSSISPGGVSVIDLANDTVVTTISVGRASGIAITPDGARAYVPIHSMFEVAVIDTATNTVITTVPIGSVNPPRVAITPNGAFAWVTGADGSNNVTEIDTTTNTVTSTFPTGIGPTTPNGIDFTPDGAFGYVANNASENMNVAVIDIATHSVVTSIPLAGRAQGITITPDGTRAYVVHGGNPGDLGTDNVVSVINTATNTVVTTIPLGGLLFEVGFTPDGAFAYVPNLLFNNVSVIDTSTNNVVAVIPVGTDPFGIAIRPAGCPSSLAYNFSGFFPPVDNLPVFNEAKAGRAIPVKFSLDGDQGLDIFAEGYPKSQEILCDSTAQVDGIEQTVTSGSSSLSYDPSSDQYTYVWKTKKAWANTCRQLVLKLNDNSFHRANFTFK